MTIKLISTRHGWGLVLAAVLFVVVNAFVRCSEGGGINVFSVEEDIQLGAQLDQEISQNPQEYPLLDPQAYPEAYDHLYRIRDALLNTGRVKFRDRFTWQLKIIQDDETLNAFCAPGGYIYVYTGLIKFLDQESELAGVMGHEIAHADLRHSTDRLTTHYGVELLLQVVLGQGNASLGQMAASLVLLSYSRGNETQADEYSVECLCKTDYDAQGTAGFFQKLIDLDLAGNTPTFLSTHPNPKNRVSNINEHWRQQVSDSDCNDTNNTFTERYQELKNALP